MNIAPEVSDLEMLAEASAVPISKALEAARVAPTTYWRWRNSGVEPHTRTLRRVRKAIADLASVAGGEE